MLSVYGDELKLLADQDVGEREVRSGDRYDRDVGFGVGGQSVEW